MNFGNQYLKIKQEIPKEVCLITVSKFQPLAHLKQVYDSGARHFGENRVQELLEKVPLMPADTQWHFIGRLQRNKVKILLPHVFLIHSVDSVRLFDAIEEEALKQGIQPKVLIQMHIALEDSKAGFTQDELFRWLDGRDFSNSPVQICGLMGMASLTNHLARIQQEFEGLASLFRLLKENQFALYPAFDQLSMGMSGDYRLAIEAGSTMIRVGSKIFTS